MPSHMCSVEYDSKRGVLKKFEEVSLTAVLAVAATLSACSEPSRPTRICIDDQERRIPDGTCATSNGGGAGGSSRWYFLSSRQVSDEGTPALGEQAQHGSYTPEGGVAYGEAPEGGIARGGFGGAGEGDGGGHGGGGE